jgi:hypothetical protein
VLQYGLSFQYTQQIQITLYGNIELLGSPFNSVALNQCVLACQLTFKATIKTQTKLVKRDRQREEGLVKKREER